MTSKAVRTSRIERPVRRDSPVISPSLGPGPSWLPMYMAPAMPLPRMAASMTTTRQPIPSTSGTTASVASMASADDDGVEHRAEAGPLAEGDPQEQDDEGHHDAHEPVGHRHVLDEAVLEDAPRLEAELRAQQEGHRDPEEHEPDEQLGHPVREPAGAQLLDRVHGDELDTAAHPAAERLDRSHERHSRRESGLGFDGQF